MTSAPYEVKCTEGQGACAVSLSSATWHPHSMERELNTKQGERAGVARADFPRDKHLRGGGAAAAWAAPALLGLSESNHLPGILKCQKTYDLHHITA